MFWLLGLPPWLPPPNLFVTEPGPGCGGAHQPCPVLLYPVPAACQGWAEAEGSLGLPGCEHSVAQLLLERAWKSV